jgi:hypothetical protein
MFSHVNHAQVEMRTLDIVERALRGAPIESALVECKATWPDAIKAARRLAGHANAARGEPILWVVGIDEKARSAPGVARHELADWITQVGACFLGEMPDLRFDLPVQTPVDTTVMALYFETMRIPYVVRNPVAGQPGGGPVESEIPWRYGTRIRSARHEDVLSMLRPVQHVPDVDVISADLSASRTVMRDSQPGLQWSLDMRLYTAPASSERLVIPFYRCRAWVGLGPLLPSLELEGIKVGAAGMYSSPKGRSPVVAATEYEVIIDAPSAVDVSVFFETKALTPDPQTPARVRLELWPTHALLPAVVQVKLPFVMHDSTGRITWGYQRRHAVTKRGRVVASE